MHVGFNCNANYIYMILIDNIYEIDRKDRQTVDLMYIDIIILLMLILSNID